VAASITLTAAPSLAAGWGAVLGRGPTRDFDDEDLRMLLDAIRQTVEAPGTPEPVAWRNECTGAGGTPPNFVPGEEGAAGLAGQARSGVRLRIVTNTLAATDVAAVHAGYAKRREELLRAGVRLFELKPDAGTSQANAASSWLTFTGGSTASLHGKTFATDGREMFVGSFNLDPRSIRLNTEIGLVMSSPTLADRLSAELDRVRRPTPTSCTWPTTGPWSGWSERPTVSAAAPAGPARELCAAPRRVGAVGPADRAASLKAASNGLGAGSRRAGRCTALA
jgi:phosphatidylserine/phosphatidylglycerophosphate/cardiolipin synthase-like enzyme